MLQMQWTHTKIHVNTILYKKMSMIWTDWQSLIWFNHTSFNRKLLTVAQTETMPSPEQTFLYCITCNYIPVHIIFIASITQNMLINLRACRDSEVPESQGIGACRVMLLSIIQAVLYFSPFLPWRHLMMTFGYIRLKQALHFLLRGHMAEWIRHWTQKSKGLGFDFQHWSCTLHCSTLISITLHQSCPFPSPSQHVCSILMHTCCHTMLF